MNTGRFRVGFATDIGRRRTQNQDNFAVAPDLGLFIVADGMGGHQGGETASLMVSEIVPEAVRKSEQSNPDWDPRGAISHGIALANRSIYDRALQTEKLNGMGTTTTALIFKDEDLIIGHVGDSRCYLLRPLGDSELGLWQMTRDHSLVQEKLRAGMITRDEIKTDRMKNVITRSVGFERDVNVETYHFRPQPGDIFLICSDGLSGMITEAVMQDLVRKHLIEPRLSRPAEDKDIDEAVRELIAAANAGGGDDNITAILIEVCGK